MSGPKRGVRPISTWVDTAVDQRRSTWCCVARLCAMLVGVSEPPAPRARVRGSPGPPAVINPQRRRGGARGTGDERGSG